MNDMSVSAIKLPRLRVAAVNRHLGRKLLLRVLERIDRGALVISEGGDSFRFGEDWDGAGLRAEINVHDPRVYGRLLSGGAIAAGETYIEGMWSSPDLAAVTRLFSANIDVLQVLNQRGAKWARLALNIAHRLNRNSRNGARRNISAHYDLGNEFFALFLDPEMMYSAALFPEPELCLERASQCKLAEIAAQLELGPEDHLLEIGTGWGGMALYAARHHGCRVTTTTISRRQYEHARQRVKALALEDRVTVLCEDYRNLSGEYDKLVSIEMIEAVGHQYYGEYFRRCAALLKPGGRMVIQAITVQDQRYELARDSVDFIKRYVFPGGCLPSLAVICDHVARDSDLQVVHLRDITRDYAITLAHWRRRFLDSLAALQHMGYGEDFIRMWDYYLSYCEGGFRERIISTVQLALAKPGYRFPEPR